jgi:multiple sugar transport system permease protein
MATNGQDPPWARLEPALLTLKIVPAVVILVLVYLLMLQLKLIDTWLGLIVVYTAFT